ncbi:type II toxin-antitoxin system RelE/ParE family toxin [Epilithonimonas hominis]|uniref:type II toxin-antitoxin system RelE/ParE family toxin n=1 Tax=Epilithonimonas hominis TaxID=420404 RepID=UPI0028998744|nr:type II toxin-antitoxin system RelE/ParE family toxin [Epilithonimonas hominis]
MAFKVIISDEAKLDLENSYLYYRENASKKVADNFIKDFRKSIKIISDNPYFKIWFEEFRAKPLGKYPFLVFFSVDKKESTIVIARVFHTSQNPEKYP